MWKNLLQFGKGRDRINARNIIAAGRQVSAAPNGPVRVKEALSTADFFCTTILIISISRSVFKTSRPDFLDITGVRRFYAMLS
jgi:hypothetical protein